MKIDRTWAKCFQKTPVSSFNRVCLIFAFFWLAITIPIGIVIRPTWSDFSQFYMGGVVANSGNWDALYPIPIPGSLDNPGLRFHSWAKLKWRALCQSHG